MSLVLSARAELRFDDGRSTRALPLMLAVFRDVPERAFGPGYLVGIGEGDEAERLLGEPSVVSDRVLALLGIAGCADRLAPRAAG